MSSSRPIWSEITAVFGGRFDPPHLGHREAVRGLFQYPGVQQVLILPSGCPPHKPATMSAEHRVAMARLNFKPTHQQPSYPQEVSVDLTEINRSKRAPCHPNYAYDTIQELQPLFRKLAFVIGTDQLNQLHTWSRYPSLLKLCHWIVLDRKPSENNSGLETLSRWNTEGLVRSAGNSHWQVQHSNSFIHLVPTEAPALSSTWIRESIARTGIPPESALLPEISGYLKTHQLYGIK